MATKTNAAPAADVNVRRLLREDPIPLTGGLAELRKASAGAHAAEFRREADALQEEAEGSRAADLLTRAGVSAYLLGRHDRALGLLTRAKAEPAAAYFRGLAALSLNQLEVAEEAFATAESAGFDKASAVLKRAEAIRRQGRIDEAETLIRTVAKGAAGRAEYSFQMGCIMADRDDLDGALEYLERAADIDPHHPQALFRLASIAAMRGDETEAVQLYERSLSIPPVHLGAMLNLGLLYEDAEQYRSAAYCFKRVLDADPTNERARLYYRDIEATDNMYYDEDSARLEAKRAQILAKPLADFELSVRSRNCLQSMNIHTLGDLTRYNEAELLAGKNFGETSLEEVRDLLASQGLNIGENAYDERPRETSVVVRPSDLSPQEQILLAKPISDLDFSVRARKCMARLGITVVGDLTSRTADELLSTRNFGVTSLNEVRQKLGELNLTLRND
ncbi:MAG: tetratricopeptide repeat protein [Planctomycetota bacterium]|nr:tetratricopeptide repeat protein [Planctomycetaceae bacterium]MDQ3330143.1 tetratricopeptide repeat protein [Planctomycetota bacterium]